MTFNRNKTLPGKGGLAKKLLPGSGKPSGVSQISVIQHLQGPATLVSTQAVTGLLDTGYIAPSLSSLIKASSWKALYDEYRLLEIEFTIQAVGLNNGITKFVVDDEDTTSPTADWMNSRRGFYLSHNSSSTKSHAKILYRSEDIDDLTWNSTNSESTYTPMALKMYSSLSGYGSTTNSYTWLISWVGKFEFRGIGANT